MSKSFLSVLVLGCALTAPVASAQPTLQVSKVAEGVWAAQPETGANVGWFLSGDGVVAVDSGSTPAIARAVLAKIAETAKKPVRTLVLTHSHADHSGGVRVFAASGAQVICHENAASIVAAYLLAAPDPKDPADAKAPAGSLLQSFSERMIFVGVSQQVQLYWLGPAHTNADVVVFLPREKTLFVGDLAVNAPMPYMQSPDCDPIGWERVLVRLAGLSVEHMVPGHGAPGSTSGVQLTGLYVQKTIKLARMLVEKEVPEPLYMAKAAESEYHVEGVPLDDAHLANVKAVVRFERERIKKAAAEKKG